MQNTGYSRRELVQEDVGIWRGEFSISHYEKCEKKDR